MMMIIIFRWNSWLLLFSRKRSATVLLVLLKLIRVLLYIYFFQIANKSCVELTSVDPKEACLGGNKVATSPK